MTVCEGEKVTIRSIETIVTDYGKIQIVALNVGGADNGCKKV